MMDWSAIVIAALSGGAIVKLLDVLGTHLGLRSSDTGTAMKILENRIERLNVRVDNYEVKIAELEAERVATSQKLAEARQEMAAKDVRIKALEAENLRLEATLQEITVQLVQRDEQIDRLESRVIKLLARVDELEGKA